MEGAEVRDSEAASGRVPEQPGHVDGGCNDGRKRGTRLIRHAHSAFSPAGNTARKFPHGTKYIAGAITMPATPSAGHPPKRGAKPRSPGALPSGDGKGTREPGAGHQAEKRLQSPPALRAAARSKGRRCGSLKHRQWGRSRRLPDYSRVWSRGYRGYGALRRTLGAVVSLKELKPTFVGIVIVGRRGLRTWICPEVDRPHSMHVPHRRRPVSSAMGPRVGSGVGSRRRGSRAVRLRAGRAGHHWTDAQWACAPGLESHLRRW